VLASQFNSYAQPAIIMLSMPLALVGALLGLWVTGMTLNIYSMIGMVLLIGVVTKNSILLIDLTNQYRRARGLGPVEALIEACPVRLRPVLMTSLTLILAMVPAAFDSGPGGNGSSALAVAIRLYCWNTKPKASRRSRASSSRSRLDTSRPMKR
jgi:HAE1 family hydrophobic/amphiphilic exporter-1